MTQITGKIYQMTNGKTGAALENRFPRTVMEAVLGLNTYLQNQFSALADIYMPIEGITESKPLQEFVYRLCPSTIKPKSFSLDRIYGKTLAWNQLGRTSATSGTYYGITVTVNADGSLSVSGTAQQDIYLDFYDSRNDGNIIGGHKYYIGCGLSGGSNETYCIYDRGTYGYISDGRGAILTGTGNIFVPAFRVVAGVSVDFNVYPQFIDLTLMFGAGNEPSTVEEFESMFPGYHDYEPGKLISNDASAIETVGFNQWDEEWEVGSYYLGEKVAGQNNTIRCKNKIAIFPGETYFYKCQEYTDIIEYFDSTGAYIGRERTSSNSLFTAPSNAYYMVFVVSSDYGTTYNHDICINLSDPAKNGTYEPYRKSTMQLNLGSFQVRDSQGNVTTITGGLKSAGSVKDEIVGNKYIKRVGSVDLESLNWGKSGDFFVSNSIPTPVITSSGMPNAICSKYATVDRAALSAADVGFTIFNGRVYVKDSAYSDAAAFQAAMSGVMLYYELATPIEYTLVSPIVPTVKVGTTEARTSPNADSLSAPMVADMTYDANPNNDSASAQYALTAGRLLNSHKLWGQDFDGTQDVSGALTGVTNLNSLLYFGSNNVGIGQSNPQYKLDVSGTARVTGATTLGSTLSVSGNSTIGGTLTVTWDTTLNAHLTVYDDAIFHSDLYLYAGMALYLDQGGNNALYYDASEGTIRFVFDYASHFSDGLYSDSYITAGGVNASSDARLKDNLAAVSAEKALSVIMQLRPMEWVWNEKNAYLEGKIGAGLVAQEVESVLPFAVSNDTEYLSLNYNVFHAYEIAGLQNHEERIKALEAENAELKAKVEQLKIK